MNIRFKPKAPCTPRQEIEMTKDGSAVVPMVGELVHEQVHYSTERVYGKVSNIFRKCEQRERGTET